MEDLLNREIPWADRASYFMTLKKEASVKAHLAKNVMGYSIGAGALGLGTLGYLSNRSKSSRQGLSNAERETMGQLYTHRAGIDSSTNSAGRLHGMKEKYLKSKLEGNKMGRTNPLATSLLYALGGAGAGLMLGKGLARIPALHQLAKGNVASKVKIGGDQRPFFEKTASDSAFFKYAASCAVTGLEKLAGFDYEGMTGTEFKYICDVVDMPTHMLEKVAEDRRLDKVFLLHNLLETDQEAGVEYPIEKVAGFATMTARAGLKAAPAVVKPGILSGIKSGIGRAVGKIKSVFKPKPAAPPGLPSSGRFASGMKVTSPQGQGVVQRAKRNLAQTGSGMGAVGTRGRGYETVVNPRAITRAEAGTQQTLSRQGLLGQRVAGGPQPLRAAPRAAGAPRVGARSAAHDPTMPLGAERALVAGTPLATLTPQATKAARLEAAAVKAQQRLSAAEAAAAMPKGLTPQGTAQVEKLLAEKGVGFSKGSLANIKGAQLQTFAKEMGVNAKGMKVGQLREALAAQGKALQTGQRQAAAAEKQLAQMRTALKSPGDVATAKTLRRQGATATGKARPVAPASAAPPPSTGGGVTTRAQATGAAPGVAPGAVPGAQPPVAAPTAVAPVAAAPGAATPAAAPQQLTLPGMAPPVATTPIAPTVGGQQLTLPGMAPGGYTAGTGAMQGMVAGPGGQMLITPEAAQAAYASMPMMQRIAPQGWNPAWNPYLAAGGAGMLGGAVLT